MIRRIAFHHTAETPAGLLNLCNKRSGLAICDYADLSAPVKGLPKIAEYNQVYSWYLPYDQQKVYRCKFEFTAREFIETASVALEETQCRTARLEYYQIFDTAGDFVTDSSHLGMADLSGNTSGVKFQGSSQEILSAYDEILSAAQDIPLAMLSAICTYRDDTVAEIQMEFTRDVDTAVTFEPIIRQHPALRMMGCQIPEFRGDPWYVYVSGSHSIKINTIPITYNKISANDFYEELKRSKCWGEPEWLLGDIMPEIHKPHSGVARINPFNWSNTIDIPETVCDRRITSVFLAVNNQHVTRLILPKTVKKLSTTSLGKCMHLKELVIPGVTEIGAETFAGCKKLRDLWVSNKLKTIASNIFPSGMKLTIHAPKGSFAEQYAKQKKYLFEEIL